MENMLRRFAIVCGGDYQCAILLNHLYYEAYERGVDGIYIATIELASLSRELRIDQEDLDGYFLHLSEGVRVIDTKAVWNPEKKMDLIAYKCLICPEVIDERLARMQEEAEKVQKHNKRAIELDNPGTLTIEEWTIKLNAFGWSCAYCGGPYEVLEHVVPLTFPFSGTTANNCVPACSKCNNLKGPYHPDRLPAKIRKKIGERLDQIRRLLAGWYGEGNEQQKETTP